MFVIFPVLLLILGCLVSSLLWLVSFNTFPFILSNLPLKFLQQSFILRFCFAGGGGFKYEKARQVILLGRRTELKELLQRESEQYMQELADKGLVIVTDDGN